MTKKRTHHSIKRIKERTNITTTRAARSLIDDARRSGHLPEFYLGYPDFYDFLISKSHYKKVRVLNGYVFVLNSTRRTGTGCVTMYRVPDEFYQSVLEYDVAHTKRMIAYRISWPAQKIGKISAEANMQSILGSSKYVLEDDGTITYDGMRCGDWKTFVKEDVL